MSSKPSKQITSKISTNTNSSGKDQAAYEGDTPAEKLRKKESSIVMNYLNTKDVPTWFRGISSFQIVAANALFNALRDDAEQRTTHRVRACLGSMGITPMICNKDIKQLIRYSRGNDLAFLWFLMELHYKTPGNDGFTINEQIILSIITHLDMITTLRGLDRILPPRQLPKKEIARQKRLEEIKLAQTHSRKKPKPEYVLPYFDKLVRPKPYGKALSVEMPDFSVKVSSYTNYKNPNYVIANESNRWFATYKMQTSRRIINKILNEEISRIFDDFNNVSKKSENTHSLCEHHKVLKELETNLENELKVIARDRCLKHLDIGGKHKEETRQQIIEQLDHDIATYMCKFRKFTNRLRRDPRRQGNNSTSECGEEEECNGAIGDGIFNLDLGEEENLSKNSENSNDGCQESSHDKEENSDDVGDKPDKVDKIDKVDKAERAMSNSIRAELERKKKIEAMRRKCQLPTCKDNKKSGSNSEYSEDIYRIGNGDATRQPKSLSKDIQRAILSGRGEQYLQGFECDPCHHRKQTPSQTFFVAAGEHKPYEFDYRKIFCFDHTLDEQKNIKKTFIEALSDTTLPVNQMPDEPLSYDKPVRNYVDKLWKEQVAAKNEELDQLEAKRLRELPEKINKNPLDYDQDYYDPDNRELMHNMLKDGLNYLAKDPKYVLAAIPEADKLPFLREWIYERFGKVYTRYARFKSFQISMRIFRAMEKLTVGVPNPNYKNLGAKQFIDYSCRDHLMKKANAIKKDYYKLLNDNTMDEARTFWFAMRPYLCSNGPPRDTYYAYMPARAQDITRFRVWKPVEFMDAKSEWWKRKSKEDKLNN